MLSLSNSLMLSYLSIAMFRYKSRPKCCSPCNDHSERFYWDKKTCETPFVATGQHILYLNYQVFEALLLLLIFSLAKWVFC